MKDELKPCPFCGSSAVQVVGHGMWRQAECDVCGARSGVSASGDRAIAAWNRRASPHQNNTASEETRCQISPCDDHPIHRYKSAYDYLTALIDDTERRVDNAYILNVNTIYHIRAAIGAKAQEWISVETQLPETNKEVLAITCYGSFYIAMYGADGEWHEDLGPIHATHWQPLPEPPNTKATEGD